MTSSRYSFGQNRKFLNEKCGAFPIIPILLSTALTALGSALFGGKRETIKRSLRGNKAAFTKDSKPYITQQRSNTLITRHTLITRQGSKPSSAPSMKKMNLVEQAVVERLRQKQIAKEIHLRELSAMVKIGTQNEDRLNNSKGRDTEKLDILQRTQE